MRVQYYLPNREVPAALISVQPPLHPWVRVPEPGGKFQVDLHHHSHVERVQRFQLPKLQSEAQNQKAEHGINQTREITTKQLSIRGNSKPRPFEDHALLLV